MAPSDCSQVRRALRSAHAVAAGGQDRRALGLSTGLLAGVAAKLLAGVAANRNAAGGLGGRSIATRPVADIASGADTAPDTAVPGRWTPRQPAAVVTATTRMARTASQSVRRPRPRAYLRRRPDQTGGMLSAPAAACPAGPGVDGQPVTPPSHGRNLSDRTRDQRLTRRPAQ